MQWHIPDRATLQGVNVSCLHYYHIFKEFMYTSMTPILNFSQFIDSIKELIPFTIMKVIPCCQETLSRNIWIEMALGSEEKDLHIPGSW